MNGNDDDNYYYDDDDDHYVQGQPNVGHNQQLVEGQMSLYTHPSLNDE